jgi:hypothetical protein
VYCSACDSGTDPDRKKKGCEGYPVAHTNTSVDQGRNDCENENDAVADESFFHNLYTIQQTAEPFGYSGLKE